MAPHNSYPMAGGDASHSYAKNSSYQKGVIDAAKELLNAVVKDVLDFKNNPSFGNLSTFRIADFGCSTGPNTFVAVENIIEAVELAYKSQHRQDHSSSPLEYHVFFHDRINNDFNTLFRSLPPFLLSGSWNFVSGVPGSHHGRLFPKSMLHFGHSSYALQWLSKAPEEVSDRNSPAWNKGSIYCTGLSKEVSRAYYAQFKKDMESFLSSRAMELVAGGLMVIIIPALADGVLWSETSPGMAYDLLGSCLHDMAQLGLISEEKLETFNLPIYYPTITESKEVIQRNGRFSIEKMDILSYPMKSLPPPTAKNLTLLMRSIIEEVIKERFGDEIVDELFQRYATKLSKDSPVTNLDNLKHIELFILLKRNIN